MKRLLFLAAGFVILLAPGRSCAHALGGQWQIKDDKVVVEAYYADDTPAAGAVVKLFKQSNRDVPLVEIKTDMKGVCSFARPEAGKYRIVVDAGAGHRKELFMEIAVPPGLIPGITLAWGSASEGGFSSLSFVPIFAMDFNKSAAKGLVVCDHPREEFTSYPWNSVILAVGGLAGVALVFWMMRKS